MSLCLCVALNFGQQDDGSGDKRLFVGAGAVLVFAIAAAAAAVALVVKAYQRRCQKPTLAH